MSSEINATDVMLSGSVTSSVPDQNECQGSVNLLYHQCMFIYDLFNAAVSSSDCILSMMGQLVNNEL
jgi:hypothetical protein